MKSIILVTICAFICTACSYKKPQVEKTQPSYKIYESNYQSSKPPSQSTTNGNSCSNLQMYRCLALAWGPDVCGQQFAKYAKKNLNINVYNIVTSPTCGKYISNVLGESFTQNDLTGSLITGALDDIGSKSWESGGVFGVIGAAITKGTSFALKLGIYDACTSKC